MLEKGFKIMKNVKMLKFELDFNERVMSKVFFYRKSAGKMFGKKKKQSSKIRQDQRTFRSDFRYFLTGL